MTNEELMETKLQIEGLLALRLPHKLQVELEYNLYKGTGKCWAARVDPTTKKILGFVDAESVVKTDRNKGYKVFLLADGYYLTCEAGTKTRDSRSYIKVSNGETENF